MPKEDPFVNRAQLLKAIKKYPEIWDSNNKLHMCRSVTAPMWNEIAEQFGGHVPTVKLQSIWSQMKYHYHNLVHRQILHKERFTTKWEHFEPMSFMYNITVSKIIGSNSTSNGNANQSTAAAAATTTIVNNCSGNSDNKETAQSNNLSQITAVSTSGHSQGRGRPSCTFAWLTNAPPSPPSVFSNITTTTTSTPTSTASPLELNIELNAFTGLSAFAPANVDAAAMPVNSALRKPGRPGSMHSGLRGRIIDTIKMHPAIWGSRQRDQRGQCQNRTSKIWKEIASHLGLTPTLIQTRWAIIKQRYVDELQKERYALYARQPFHSTWEHFHRMSFMRDILIKKVDEREQTREHIQEIVNEQHQQQLMQHHYDQLHNVKFGRVTTIHHNNNSSTNLNSHTIPTLEICGDGSDGICDVAGNSFIGMTAMSSLAAPLHMIGGNRRARTATVKTENDLEWDPFEMILHVHGTDPASPATN